MTWRLLALALALPAVACTDISGLGDLDFDGGAGGATATAAGGSGGSGGSSGVGGSGPAPDWSESFDAVYNFEVDAPSLGLDSSGNARNLAIDGAPTLDTGDAQQGAASALLSTAPDGFSETYAAFNTPNGTSVTAGAWARIDDIGASGDADVIHKRNTGAGGFKLSATRSGGEIICTIDDGPNDYTPVSAAGYLTAGSWWHGVCRFDATAGRASLTLDGAMVSEVNGAAIAGSGEAFTISDVSTPDPVLGGVDEVFFVRRALSDSSLLRIWACGIDGARCSCNGADYESCGRATADCSQLPPCDAAQPTFDD